MSTSFDDRDVPGGRCLTAAFTPTAWGPNDVIESAASPLASVRVGGDVGRLTPPPECRSVIERLSDACGIALPCHRSWAYTADHLPPDFRLDQWSGCFYCTHDPGRK